MIDQDDRVTPNGRPRLLVITDTLAGGLGGAVSAQYEWFNAHDWDVKVAAGWLEAVPLEVPGSIDLDMPTTVRNVPRLLRASSQIRALRRSFRPDIVHCHGMRSFIAARLASSLSRKRAPWVTLHGKGTVPSDPPGYNIVRTLGVSVTSLLAGRAFSVAPDAPRGWVFTPYASHWLAQMEQFGPPTTAAPTFLWLGRLMEPKQPDLFIRALAALAKDRPDVRGIVVGDGPNAAEIHTLAESLDAPVEFFGHVVDPRPLMEQAWAVVMLSSIEGVPFSLEEAMWTGRAIVSSPLPGATWLTDGDPRTMADGVEGVRAAMERLCDRETAIADGQRLAVQARKRLSPDMPWPQLDELYRAAIDRELTPSRSETNDA